MKNGDDGQIYRMSRKSLNHYHLFNYCNLCQSFYVLHSASVRSCNCLCSYKDVISWLFAAFSDLIARPMTYANLNHTILFPSLMQPKTNFKVKRPYEHESAFLSHATYVGLNGKCRHAGAHFLSACLGFYFFHPSFYAHTLFRLILHQPAASTPTPRSTTHPSHLSTSSLKSWPLMSLLFPHPEWVFIISPPLPELQLLYTFTT